MRLFVAIELPEGVRGRMHEIQNKLSPAPGIKWVAPQNFHLTVKFLGETASDKLASVQAEITAQASEIPPFELDLAGLGAFPNTRSPRVVWVGIGGEVAPLKRLTRQLNRKLEPLGFPAEERPFSGHLTLGRARRPGPDARLQKAIETFGEARVGHVTVRELGLFSSTLGRGEPIYACLSRHRLGQADQELPVGRINSSQTELE